MMTLVSTPTGSRSSTFSYSTTFSSLGGRKGRADGFLTTRSRATRSTLTRYSSGGGAAERISASNGRYSSGVLGSAHSTDSGNPVSGACPEAAVSVTGALAAAKALAISSSLRPWTPAILASVSFLASPSTASSGPSADGSKWNEARRPSSSTSRVVSPRKVAPAIAPTPRP